jgi:polyhydroxybutyrate depolymerase
MNRGGKSLLAAHERRGRGATVAALALLAACGRSLPELAGDERTAAEAAASVPVDPSAGCRDGALPAADGERRELTVGGEQRSYIVDAPAAPAGRPLAVVLSFHGFRGSAWQHRLWTGWGALAGREGLIALNPEGHEGVELLQTTGRGWDFRPGETRDTSFVRALLDAVERERCVDRRRVFATGMSNGGFFTNLLGCVLADRLAAVAPVAGAIPLRRCTPSRPVPILLIQGNSDRVVSPDMVRGARDWWTGTAGCGAAEERDGCARYGGCAADVVYCEGPQGHIWPSDATGRIWRFFQAHPRR